MRWGQDREDSEEEEGEEEWEGGSARAPACCLTKQRTPKNIPC